MNFLFRISQQLRTEQKVPYGYALAWHDYNCNVDVYAPVPLNFLLCNFPYRFWAVVSKVYHFLKQYGVVWPRSEGCYYWDSRIECRPWRWLVG